MRRDGLLTFVLFAAASCTARPVDIRIARSGPGTPASYELRLYQGPCGAPGRVPEDDPAPLRTLQWLEGESPNRLGEVGAGRYALVAIVRDETCTPIAVGCAEFSGDGESVRIEAAPPSPAPPRGCADDMRCVNGFCGVSDRDAGEGALDAGPAIADAGLDAGFDADVRAPFDGGDGGGPLPECTDDLECGPRGVGRCMDSRCVPCPVTDMAPAILPAADGFGREIAVATYVPTGTPTGEPYAWVVTRDNAASSRLFNRAIPLPNPDATALWVEEPGFDSIDGRSVRSPSSIALITVPEDNDVWIGAIAQVEGSPEIISSRLFAEVEWLQRRTPVDTAIGPGFVTRGPSGLGRYGWRVSRFTGAGDLRSVPIDNFSSTVIPAMAPILDGPPATAAGTTGPWMVYSEGLALYFWSPEDSLTVDVVDRTDGGGPPSFAYEGGESYLVAYATEREIFVRRLNCTPLGCGFAPSAEPTARIATSTRAEQVRIAAIPGGGAVVTWVDTTSAPRILAQVLPDRLDSGGVATVGIAGVAADREIVDVELTVRVHEGTVYVPIVYVAGPTGGGPGSGTDFAAMDGLQFSRTTCP